MSTTTLGPQFQPVLASLGDGAAEFFLAAGLYHAEKVSFGAAAALAGLKPEAFHERLRAHFGLGFILDDEVGMEDLEALSRGRSAS